MKKIILIIFLLISSNLLAKYKDVTVTRDLNPNAKYDTYQDWLANNQPRQTHFNEVRRSYSNQRDEGFLIIVNDALYEEIEQALTLFQQDLSDEGFNTFLLEFDGTIPEDLRQQIMLYYQTENIVNAVLIGNLPVAWFELFEDWNNNGIQDPDESWVEFPCDLYFSDIDGIWADDDSNGILDFHEGDKHPEIGIGRIAAGNMNMLDRSEPELINNYFLRNHLFRSGLLSSHNTSLAYIDDDWEYWGNQYQDAMQLAYSSVELVNEIEETNATDYLDNRLVSDYEFIQVHVHSGPDAHYFYYNNGNSYQLVHNYDIAAVNPTAHFYNLFACSNSRFTTENNMGGMYIYGNEHGLATLGSTKTGSMLGFSDFYQPFSEDKTVGESMRLWWENNVDTGADWRWERSWFYGMIIQGDPSLRKEYEPSQGIFANFGVDSTAGFVPKTVNFFDLSISHNPIVSWEWDFQNDGIIDSYAPNPSFTYDEPGIYSVSLTASNIYDSTATAIKEDYISVFACHIHNITQNIDYGTIQQGIAEANDGDTLILDPNNYQENIDFNGKNITVASQYITTQDESYISQTVIDGNQQGTVVTLSQGESEAAVLTGLTIKNGNSTYGGGIHLENSSPNLKNLVITGNSATVGGGICCNNSSPSLEQITMVGNNVENVGSGIFCFNNSAPNLKNTILSHNSGNYGIYVNDTESEPSISYSNFWNNENGNFYGVMDSVGVNVHTNVNGDSCDLFFNIQLDPMFSDLNNGDFQLLENSPCLDAGDPDLPFDPDGTIADMGAFYYNQNYIDDPTTPTNADVVLDQNYPNPFRNTTSLRYFLAKPSRVKLSVYNIRGQLIEILVDEQKNAGEYSHNFHPTGLSSGVYLFIIETDRISEIKKAIFLK